MGNFMKNTMQKLILLFFLLIAPCFVQTQEDEKAPILTDNELAQGKMTASYILNQTLDQTSLFQSSMDKLIKDASGMQEILQKIAELNQKIKKIKDENNISALETQLVQLKNQIDNAAIDIFAKAVDPADRQNLYRKINSLINQIYTDQIFQDKIDRIASAKRAIAEQIRKPIRDIQQIGLKIKTLSAPEQNQIDQIMMQILPLQSQLIGAKMAKEYSDKVNPLDNELIRQQNIVQDKLRGLPTDLQSRLRKYKDAKKRLVQMLRLIRQPADSATVTEDEIAFFDTSNRSE